MVILSDNSTASPDSVATGVAVLSGTVSSPDVQPAEKAAAMITRTDTRKNTGFFIISYRHVSKIKDDIST